MPKNEEKGRLEARTLGGKGNKLFRRLNQSGCLAQALIFMASLVAIVATIALVLWFLVTFIVPLKVYSRETQRLVLSNGQTLQVKYPNMILGDDKPVDIILVLYGKSNGELADFTVEIPSGLTVRKPAAQEHGKKLRLTASSLGSDTEPDEIKISLVNSRFERGLWLSVHQSIVITSPQLQGEEAIDVSVETALWSAAQRSINNTINEGSALILLITGFLSGAGTLVLQYAKTKDDRSREEREKRETQFREQLKENPVDALDSFSKLDRDEADDSDFSIKKKLVEAFGWEDKLRQIILEKLKSKGHYFDAKRAAEVLYAVCGVFNLDSQADNLQHSRSLAPFCKLVCEDDRKNHPLTEEDAQYLLIVSKRWHELKPLVTDMLHDFAIRRENLPIILNKFASEESGQLLRDANIDEIIEEHRRNFPDDESATAIFEVLTQDVYWRETGTGRERRLSDKVLRWLFSCFSEPVDADFSLGSEYAELEDRSKQSVMELPVFEQIKNPDTMIVFGEEGVGKTVSALWLVDQYTTSTKADVFPIYALYEPGVELKNWIMGTIARALINFTADNPRKFITSSDSRKTAMGRLMLWHARNLETLRFNLYSSSVNRSTTDIEQVIEYIGKFKPPKSAAKMTKDEMLSSLHLAYPAGIEIISFLWDIPASAPHEDVVSKIKEMAGLAVSLSRQNVVIKIFAPLATKDDVVGYLGGVRHAGDLTWGNDQLLELLNRKMKDKFVTLWDRSVDDAAGTLVRAAECSPRRLVRLLLHLVDYVDRRHVQEGEKLNISVINDLMGSQPQKSDDHSHRPNHPASVNNSDNAVFVSYAWGGESERTVDDLERAFTEIGISIVRDKKDLDYKGSILGFEQRIGRGQCVILIISDKYLRSEHCMYELLLVDENQRLRERIFPIVLADAAIYNPIDRLQYINHWEEKKAKLNQALKGIQEVTYVNDIISNLEKYDRIRRSFDHLSSLLSDMNALTPELHSAQGFSTLINAIRKRLGTL